MNHFLLVEIIVNSFISGLVLKRFLCRLYQRPSCGIRKNFFFLLYAWVWKLHRNCTRWILFPLFIQIRWENDTSTSEVDCCMLWNWCVFSYPFTLHHSLLLLKQSFQCGWLVNTAGLFVPTTQLNIKCDSSKALRFEELVSWAGVTSALRASYDKGLKPFPEQVQE